MEFDHTVWIIVALTLALAIAQGLIMPVALVTMKRGRSRANQALAALLFSMAMGLTGHLIELTELQPKLPVWYFSSTVTPLLFGPFIYFYVRLMIDENFQLRWRSVLHFIPASLYMLRVYMAVTAPEPIVELRDTEKLGLSLLSILWPILKTISITGYVILSLKCLANNQQRLSNTLSQIDSMTLQWLKNILFTLLGLTAFSWLLFFYAAFYGPSLGIDNLYTLGLAVVVVWISIRGYQQPEVLTSGVIGLLNASDGKNEPVISMLDKQQIDDRLEQLVDVQSFYLDEQMSLPKLAQLLDKRIQVVSLYINDVEGCNFYDFINKLRIEAACQKLQDSSNKQSIIDIAYACGFSNKSTFNAAFKKHAGMTPSEYRRM